MKLMKLIKFRFEGWFCCCYYYYYYIPLLCTIDFRSLNRTMQQYDKLYLYNNVFSSQL